MEFESNRFIKELTTFKIGGRAKIVAFPETEEDVHEAMDRAESQGLPWVIMGKGSNILFGDEDYEGMVIYLGKNYRGIVAEEEGAVCLSGTTLSDVCRFGRENSYQHIINLSGIPGTLGGALITNAEAHKVSIGDFVEWVDVLENGEKKRYLKDECQFTYRHSVFEDKENLLILRCKLHFEKGDKEAIEKRYEEVRAFRREKQPKLPSAGSVYKNPKEGAAGYFIDQAGFKGVSEGDAMVSEIHGNFILNKGNAKAEDVLKLMAAIEKKILDAYGITLVPEVKKINC